MKKEIEVSWGGGYVINNSTPKKLVGEILQIIEILGLQDRQEEQTKNLIRQTIGNTIANESIEISSEEYSRLRREDYNNNNNKSHSKIKI
jgi:hypothetical protein